MRLTHQELTIRQSATNRLVGVSWGADGLSPGVALESSGAGATMTFDDRQKFSVKAIGALATCRSCSQNMLPSL